MRVLITFASIVIFTAAVMFEEILKDAVEIN